MKLIEATTLVPPQEAFPYIKLDELPRGFQPVAATDRLFYNDASGDLIVKDPSGALRPCPDAYSALEICRYIHEQARDIRDNVADKWWYTQLLQPLMGLMVQVGIKPPPSFQLIFYGEPIDKIEADYALTADKLDSRIKQDANILIEVRNQLETLHQGEKRPHFTITPPGEIIDKLLGNADNLSDIKLQPMKAIAQNAIQELVGGNHKYYFGNTVSHRLKIGDRSGAHRTLHFVIKHIDESRNQTTQRFVIRAPEPEELRPAA